MSKTVTTTTKKESTWSRRSNLQFQEMDERKIVLKDHQAKWREIWNIADFGNRSDGEMSAIMQKAAEAIKLQDPPADMSAYILEAK